MLKSFIKELSEVDEKFHELYAKTSDGYKLQTDATDYKSKVDEFRNNNNTLNNEVSTLKKELEKFKDIDPKKYQEAVSKLQEIGDKKLIDEGNVDELLAQRTERMRQDYEGKIKALEENYTKYEGLSKNYKTKLDDITVNDQINKTISDVGVVRKGAMLDILARAKRDWKVTEDGNLLAQDSEGNTIYGTDGKDPLTVQEWSQNLLTSAPHLFEPNTGGNSKGSSSNSTGNKTVISAGDIGSNLEAVAQGKAIVQ